MGPVRTAVLDDTCGKLNPDYTDALTTAVGK
jgi:hypothetical protein